MRQPRSAPVLPAQPLRSRSTALFKDLTPRRSRPTGEGRLEIITDRSGAEALELIRHDAAHVMAEAVKDLYPDAKVTIGPAIENGFYYDFKFRGVTITDADLDRIEAAMRLHLAADEPFNRRELPVAEAVELSRFKGRTTRLS